MWEDRELVKGARVTRPTDKLASAILSTRIMPERILLVGFLLTRRRVISWVMKVMGFGERFV